MFGKDNRNAPTKPHSGMAEFFKDVFSEAIAMVIIYVLGGLAVVIGLALYYDVSFFTALGGCILLLIGYGVWKFLAEVF